MKLSEIQQTIAMAIIFAAAIISLVACGAMLKSGKPLGAKPVSEGSSLIVIDHTTSTREIDMGDDRPPCHCK